MIILISCAKSSKDLLIKPTSKFFELTTIRKYRNSGNNQYITVSSIDELIQILNRL